jgi:hypothetical protein
LASLFWLPARLSLSLLLLRSSLSTSPPLELTVGRFSDLCSGEIQIFDNKKAQSIIYRCANQRRSDIPHATVALFNLENAEIKSVAWNEAVSALRRFEASDYMYFYAVTDPTATAIRIGQQSSTASVGYELLAA